MSNHQFKPGEKVLLEVEIINELHPIYTNGEQIYRVARCSPSGEKRIFPARAETILSFPREGEYRLTVEELLLLIRLALLEEDFSGTNPDTLEVYIPNRGNLTSGELEAWLIPHLKYVRNHKHEEYYQQWLHEHGKEEA